MVARLDKAQLIARREIVAAPADRFCKDRSFELPTGLYAAMAGLFFAYLTVMTIGFAHQQLVVPMAVNFFFVAAFFVVPALWVRMKPDNAQRALRWFKFRQNGIETPDGVCAAGAATVQMLLLPVLILAWAVIVTTTAALV